MLEMQNSQQTGGIWRNSKPVEVAPKQEEVK